MTVIDYAEDSEPSPPSPAPGPRPVVVPVRPRPPRVAPSASGPAMALLAAAVIAAAAALGYYQGHRGPAPAPTPSAVDGVALGRAYAPVLASTYGDAWLKAADALEAGKTVKECGPVVTDTWKDLRVKAFEADVAPKFDLVMPGGAEPKDSDQKAAVLRLWRSFSAGLKGQGR